MSESAEYFWTHVEPNLRAAAYATLDSDPQILLETDGGPVGLEADIVLARLIGFDDQIIKDGLRLKRAELYVQTPIIPSRWTLVEPDEPVDVMPRTATYVLQSGFVRTGVTSELLPDLKVDPPWRNIEVLYLRYRRRS